MSSILMVRPACFGFNAEAARSNAFAKTSDDPELAHRVLMEFDDTVERLTRAGVDVLVLNDTPNPQKPDAIFPNNWVSFHGDGTVVLYPMAAESRRRERDLPSLSQLLASEGFDVRTVIDLSGHEQHGRFLEGTGSLILDRPNSRAYANLSPRTHPVVVRDFHEKLGYSTRLFEARDPSGRPIYHTNVLMSIGSEFAIVCLESVAEKDRPGLVEDIEASGRTLIAIDFEQLKQFACNIIELRSDRGDPVIALSSAALSAFRPAQRRILEGFAALAVAPIPTIEAVGGGSLRCMIADVHLPRG